MPKEADVGKMFVYGNRLRGARVAAGVSQSAVAAAIGCRQPFISKAEAGEMLLRPYDYAVVAGLLGIDLEALIGALTPKEEAEAERIVAAAAAAHRQWHANEPR